MIYDPSFPDTPFYLVYVAWTFWIETSPETPGIYSGSIQVRIFPSGPTLIDPVDSGFLTLYPNGAAISTDTDVLASGGTIVQGAAADGVTQVLVRIPAANEGETFNLSLQDEDGSATDVGAIGGLFRLGDSPLNAASALTVNAVDTTEGPMAFAAYLAPTDFRHNTSDDNIPNRVVSLGIKEISRSVRTLPIYIVRPPVFLIHGLWSNGST